MKTKTSAGVEYAHIEEIAKFHAIADAYGLCSRINSYNLNAPQEARVRVHYFDTGIPAKEYCRGRMVRSRTQNILDRQYCVSDVATFLAGTPINHSARGRKCP